MNSKNRRHNPLLQLLMFAIILIPVVACVPIAPVMEISQNSQIYELGTSNYVTVPITINVVQGTTISKAQIEANIKRMNEIYNSEVVVFVWDGTINTVPDPDGNNDGAVSGADDRSSVRGNASQNAGGQGVSITVSSGLGANTNGYSTIGGAHGPIVTNSTNGDTWAHEMQHALGQSHGAAQPADEDINGPAPGNGTGWDVNGDGRVTSEDQGYNLWGRASDRTGSKINCTKIYNAAKAIPGAKIKKRPQTALTNPKDTAKSGSAEDSKSDQKNNTGTQSPAAASAKKVDLVSGGLIKDYINKLMKFWVIVSEMPTDNCSYDLCFDYITGGGGDTAPFLGADTRLQFNTSYFVGWEVLAYRWTGSWTPEGSAGPFEPMPLQEAIGNDTGGGWVESFFDVYLTVEINESDPLGWIYSELTGDFDMWLVSEWNDLVAIETFQDESPIFGVNIGDNGTVQTVSINGENVTGTKTMQVNGMSFTPNGNVSIYIDGAMVGWVLANAGGNFSTSITVPNTTKENAILMVMDDSGNGDAAYINIEAFVVIPQPGPIPFGLLPVALVALTLVIFIKSKRKNDIF